MWGRFQAVPRRFPLPVGRRGFLFARFDRSGGGRATRTEKAQHAQKFARWSARPDAAKGQLQVSPVGGLFCRCSHYRESVLLVPIPVLCPPSPPQGSGPLHHRRCAAPPFQQLKFSYGSPFAATKISPLTMAS